MATPQTLLEMDSRLRTIRQSCRYAEYRIPGSEKDGYFSSNTNFAAFEHRSVLQVLPFCVLHFFADNVVQAIVKYIDWYMVACRAKQFSEATFSEMRCHMLRTLDAFKALAPWLKSAFKLVKIHAMSHFKEAIRRSGPTSEYSSNIYEKLHTAHMKNGYRASNHRHATKQIVAYNRRMEGLHAFSKFDCITRPVEKVTALDKAVKLGENVLSGKFTIFRRFWLEQTDSQGIPKRAKMLLNAQPELLEKLMPALETFCADNDIQTPEAWIIWKGIAVPAGPGERFSDWPMYGKATFKFHDGPWFSSVGIQMEPIGAPAETHYGQLRLLFSCRAIDQEFKLALVKLYEELPTTNQSRLLGCKNLQWSSRGKKGTKRAKGCCFLGTEYIVVDISNILRVVHVVPDFLGADRFYVNRSKF